MKIYKIFIASSVELKAERELLERLIGKKNKELLKKKVQLVCDIWEDMDDSASPTRKQDDYNESLKEASVVMVLFWTKMGKFTDEEFNTAYELSKNNKRVPRVYLYKKTARAPSNVSSEDQRSLEKFEKKLNDLVQFPTLFENPDALENAFNKSIENLFNEGYLTHGEPAKLLYTDGNGVPATFIGREEELKAIREKLDAGGTLLLINAEGGIGKTTLAAKYWEESLYQYKHNAWLFCENGIVESLKKLAPELNVNLTGLNEKQQIEALKRGLLKVHEDLLLVLDNANDPNDLKVFKETFRGFHWHVLVTSRCSGVFEGQEYPVKHLPPPLAKDLFVSNYRENTPGFDALLDRLLEALNYHTLLVEIFSKNMKQWSKYGDTLKGFLGHLEEKGLFLERHSFKITTDYTANVHKEGAGKNTDAILSILYDFSKLEETERYWLVNMALLPAVHRTPVFLSGLFKQDKYAFSEIMESLAEKGWLSSEDNGYRISPVVQQVVLEKHQATLWDDGKALVQNITDLLALEQDKDNITTKFQWLPESKPMVGIYGHSKDPLFSAFLNNRAMVFHDLGGEANLLEAKVLLQKALANNIANFGEEAPAVAVRQSNLATVLNALGGEANLLEAKVLLQKALASNIANFGEKAPTVAVCQSNLALALQGLGGEENLLEAKVLLQKALASGIENFGEKAPTVAVTQSNLATVLKALGGEANLLEAKVLLEKSLASGIANFGEKAPAVAVRQSNLALVLKGLGGEANLLEAKVLLQKALANNIANFGAGSGAILIPSWNLFGICYQLKHHPEAVGIIKKIFPISEQHLPDTHPLKGYIKNQHDQIMTNT